MLASGAAADSTHTNEHIEAAPIGNLFHRNWVCLTLEPQRKLHAPAKCLTALGLGILPNDLLHTRAIAPAANVVVPPPDTLDSFVWHIEPPGESCKGVFYPDGSRLDGPNDLIARNGWSFVAINEHNVVVAAAYGVTPDWVTDIPGAEAWAIYQCSLVSDPGSTYRSDCKPCCQAIWRGINRSTTGDRKHARIFTLMAPCVDDIPASSYVWMPAHTTVADIGRAQLSDGSFLTTADRDANDLADKLAKKAGVTTRPDSQSSLRFSAPSAKSSSCEAVHAVLPDRDKLRRRCRIPRLVCPRRINPYVVAREWHGNQRRYRSNAPFPRKSTDPVESEKQNAEAPTLALA